MLIGGKSELYVHCTFSHIRYIYSHLFLDFVVLIILI